LDELPETLDGTYEQTLRMIDKQKRGYAYRLFQCLVVSKRPLLVEELAEIFAIQPNAETIPAFDASLRPVNPEEFVLSACSTLIAVVNVGLQKVVQFSHFSVREYLTSDRITISDHVSRFHIIPRPAHSLLATACLSILLQLGERVDKDNIVNFPLAPYAAQYWVDHAQFEDVSSDVDIKHGMECLFDKKKSHFASWLWLYNIDYPSLFIMTSFSPTQSFTVPLYYAALCGFRDIAEYLIIAHPQDVNARGGKCMTPLHAALEKGHLSVAMLLLNRGADVGSRDSQSQTPLHIASYHGYAEVVSLLIDRGADLNAEGFNQETPLYLALTEGRQDVALLLLGCSTDVNHPEHRGLTPLHHASLHGRIDIVRLLLECGADRNPRDNNSLTPLHHASMGGLNAIVELLLGHGADPNLPENRGLTALHLASVRGLNDIVQLLLDHGADTSRRDNRGWTAQHHASLRGLNDIVQLLLDHGSVTSRPGNSALTPLHLASLRDNNDTVKLFRPKP
jgi:ankyrin repeat protein